MSIQFVTTLGLMALRNEGDSAVVEVAESFLEGTHYLVSLGMGASIFIQVLTGLGFAITGVWALTQLDRIRGCMGT